MTKLLPRQKLFCEEYIKDWNGKQAAIRAGYSETAATEQAHENLQKPHIASYIERLCDELLEQTGVRKHVIVDRLFKEACDMENTGAVRVSALCSLGKYLGMFTNKVEHSGNIETTAPPTLTRIIVSRNDNGDWVSLDMETNEEVIVRKGDQQSMPTSQVEH